MEGDGREVILVEPDILFQSTPSAWRETQICADHWQDHYISIHSLRMEGDCGLWLLVGHHKDFNPLPPHGGRRVEKRNYNQSKNISIHSLRMEGDQQRSIHFPTTFPNFNPLPPHGGRHFQQGQRLEDFHFNPLPPHGGRLRRRLYHLQPLLFQSTPSAWRETWRELLVVIK